MDEQDKNLNPESSENPEFSEMPEMLDTEAVPEALEETEVFASETEPEIFADVEFPEAEAEPEAFADVEIQDASELPEPAGFESSTENWLDEFLPAPEIEQELAVDETAVNLAGLTRPEDAVLEQIIEETQAVSDLPEAFQPEAQPTPESQPLFQDEAYREAFGDGAELAAVFDETQSGAPETEFPFMAELPVPEVPEEPEEPKKPEKPQRVRKRRPYRKKGYGLFGIPHIIATFVWLAITVAIGVTLGRVLWVCAEDVLAFGREDKLVTVTIDDPNDIDAVANTLHKAGLIRYPQLFKLYASFAIDDGELSAGTFTVNTIYDYHALANAMSPYASGREEVRVTFPEGYTCADIFASLEAHNVCTVAELEAWAASGTLSDYWFLEGVERGDKYCLEGYLFPDTYDFYTRDNPRRVLEKLLDTFEVRFTDILQEELAAFNERFAEMLRANNYEDDYIENHQITIRELTIIASLIEKEAAGVEYSEGITDANMIASVIYNRLSNQRDFPYLNLDATVYYAIGGKDGPLTYEDLRFDSPFNTYVEPGLPAGPICNPGRSSIYAALDPADTSYYYYIWNDAEGQHHFFETGEEQTAYAEAMSNG